MFFYDMVFRCPGYVYVSSTHNKKLRGLSPQANYTDREAAAGRRS